MTKREHDEPSHEPHESQGQDVTAGKGRRDEVGRTGIYPSSGPFPEGDVPIVTPGDINKPHDRKGPGVERNEELKGAERLPRKGNELDKPDSDQLGD
jgi:hypothetical protein